MSDQVSFLSHAGFYIFYFGCLTVLFLLALFRPIVKPLLFPGTQSDPGSGPVHSKPAQDVGLFLHWIRRAELWVFLLTILAQWSAYATLGWIPPWTWPFVSFAAACLQHFSPFWGTIVSVMAVQWLAYAIFAWFDPWFWPPIAVAAACLRKFPSFWWLILFYFFHCLFSFDGPMEGSTWTIVRSAHGDLVVIQERRVEHFFRGYPAGIDEVFSTKICRGAIVLQGEVFHFGQSWEGVVARPRVIAGGKAGEIEILFCNGPLMTIYPDRTYTVHRWSHEKRLLINLGKIEDSNEYEKCILEKMLYLGHDMSEYRDPNRFYSLIIYLIYPVFFLVYWSVPGFRVHFAEHSRSYRNHWIVMFYSFLIFGIPEPVYWPLVLMTWAWFENRPAPVYHGSILILVFLWAPLLLSCSVFARPMPWFWCYLVWVAASLAYERVIKRPEKS